MAGVGLLFRCYTRTVAADVASINKKKEHTPPPRKKTKGPGRGSTPGGSGWGSDGRKGTGYGGCDQVRSS